MKFAGTNVDMELWAEVAVLSIALEEYGINTDQFMDDKFNDHLDNIVNSVPIDEQDRLEELLKNHVVNVFVEKYAELKRQYNWEVE